MTSLYFIAILSPEELKKEVVALKNYMAVNFYSKASLKSPPHITLYPPFKMETEKENEVIKSLSDFVQGKIKFGIALDGFGCFKPRVIFVNPLPNQELERLVKALLIHLKNTVGLYDPQNERTFHPHMTIATRDLQKDQFFKAWDEFKNKEFKRDFEVSSIALLKHNSKFWDVLKVFEFS